ncbi:hypothetical protein D3C78_1168890 [compost metagenome]
MLRRLQHHIEFSDVLIKLIYLQLHAVKFHVNNIVVHMHEQHIEYWVAAAVTSELKLLDKCVERILLMLISLE